MYATNGEKKYGILFLFFPYKIDTMIVLRLRFLFLFLYRCLSVWVNPFLFFQINADFFDEEKGVFSKIQIGKEIPYNFRLQEIPLSVSQSPSVWKDIIIEKFTFPVFLKPEWGQNSNGVIRVDQPEELEKVLLKFIMIRSHILFKKQQNIKKNLIFFI